MTVLLQAYTHALYEHVWRKSCIF